MSKGNRDPEFSHVQTASCYADADYGLKPTNMLFLQPLLPPDPWRNSGWCRLPPGALAESELEQQYHATFKERSPGPVRRASPPDAGVCVPLLPDRL